MSFTKWYVILLLLLLPALAEAHTYYIDQNNSLASDSNPGTEALPAIDAFVYATALRNNGYTLTGDSHFKNKKNVIFIE